MSKSAPFLLVAALAAVMIPAVKAADNFRPPAVPLVVSNPFLSIWSEADRLTDDTTRHWTHRTHSLVSLIRIDGNTYRLMGNNPGTGPALPQVGLQVLPTRSIYDFEGSGVHVTLTFMTPGAAARPERADPPRDVSHLERPLGRRGGAQSHALRQHEFRAGRERAGSESGVGAGADGQPDGPPGRDAQAGLFRHCRRRRAAGLGLCLCRRAPHAGQSGHLALTKRLKMTLSPAMLCPPKTTPTCRARSTTTSRCWPSRFDLGLVGASPVSRHLMIGYDEVYAVKYFGQNLRPYWRRSGATPSDLFPSGGKRLFEPDAALRSL